GHRVERRVVVGVDGRGGAGQRAVGGLHHRVRRQAALGVPAVHGAARQVQPDADRAGRLHFGGGDVAPPGGEDVVVVGGGAAARQRQPGGARGGGSGHRLGVQPVPDLVGADQPLEERAVGEQALGGPLVEVVVRVHQAGGGQAAAAVDAARTGDLGGRAGADPGDPPVLRDQVADRVFGAADGGDVGAVDDDGALAAARSAHAAPPALAASRSAATRTASMIFS